MLSCRKIKHFLNCCRFSSGIFYFAVFMFPSSFTNLQGCRECLLTCRLILISWNKIDCMTCRLTISKGISIHTCSKLAAKWKECIPVPFLSLVILVLLQKSTNGDNGSHIQFLLIDTHIVALGWTSKKTSEKSLFFSVFHSSANSVSGFVNWVWNCWTANESYRTCQTCLFDA